MAKAKRSRRMGRLLFVIPVVLVILLFVVGYVQYVEDSSGLLIVEAQTSYGTSASFIAATATVSGVTKMTPYNLSLTPGTYTATYGPLEWYHTPSPVAVTVPGGRTAYAVGVYVPISYVIVVTQSGPNSTHLTVEHAVTPVIWVNKGTETIEVACNQFSAAVPPGGNYTSFFSSPGTVTVNLYPTGDIVTVVAS